MELTLTEEVEAALREGRAVVALESSVVAQGLPAPHGVEAAKACEAAVRAQGAVPATVAVIEGALCVGVSSAALERLADPRRVVAKAGVRDLGPLLAAGADAGTTVSATVFAAAHAGISLFSTGGIGGVHRGGGAPDVSSDLNALAAHPVAVVSAGAKAILDLPATLEVLETLGVPVIGLGVRELPAFYTNRSGLSLEHAVDGAAGAARLLDAHWRRLEQVSGVLLANPVPEASEIPAAQVEAAIAAALEQARAQGVRGKAVTPFLLGALARDAALGTVATNVALLVSNARMAGEIAVELSRLDPRPPAAPSVR